MEENVAASVDYIVQPLKDLQLSDTLLRNVASAMLAETKFRIHNTGTRADGSPIGSYSDSYIKVRMKQGRGSNRKVIFSLTGDLENNYKILAISDREYGLGFDFPQDVMKSQVLQDGQSPYTVPSHTRNVNGKTVNVKSYTHPGSSGFGDNIWALSESELEAFDAIVDQFITDAIRI